MKITTKYKLDIVVLSVLCCSSIWAQERQNKLSEKLTVNKDVVVKLNTSHTSIIFETWNKNTVSIEAYIQGGDPSDENTQRILDNWQVNVLGDMQEVTINSTGSSWNRNVISSSTRMDKNLQELRLLGPVITDMLGPIMENILKNPMPNALGRNHANVNYSNRPLVKNDEKYIEQWENQIREKFTEDVIKERQKWSQQFEETPEMATVPQSMSTEEDWGKEYERQMDVWASRLIKDIENQQQRVSGNITVYQYSNAKRLTNNANKVIKVWVPKEARLILNTRHGDIQLGERSNNVIASLSHTKLSGNIIDGKQTFIKASYSPVTVREWNEGKLVVNYVKNCRIQNAKNLMVNADSSNIYIQQLDENAAISGSFGVVTIANLGESFSTLDLAVQNSDFKLKLPKTAFNLSYSGAQSLISLPPTLEINTRKNFGNVFISGYQNTRSTDKMITISAKFSEVVLQSNK